MFLEAKYLRVNAVIRLTVVCMQCIFTLRSADGVFRLTHVTSDVTVRVVVYQKFPSLWVLMREDNTQYKHITGFEYSIMNCRAASSPWVAVDGIAPPLSLLHT